MDWRILMILAVSNGLFFMLGAYVYGRGRSQESVFKLPERRKNDNDEEEPDYEKEI